MNEKYVRQIIKKLKCSGKKRKEIRRQLVADIAEQLEGGDSEQVIFQRMGTPEEIAEEFNSSFSAEEQKKHKRETWAKRLTVIGIVIIGLAAAIFWALPKTYLIEDSRFFRKEEVQA